jgi:GBP family porin
MKKTLVALAVLASFASAASAANSVTLYGRADVGYEKWKGSSVAQEGSGETRFGIKVNEDLGNGIAATAQLEGRFDLDTGAKTEGRTFFDRESTIGLKGNFGHVRFGRSKSAMERGLGDNYAPGERVSTVWDNYSSSSRHSNSMFYDYATNGFNLGFNVSTKGGAAGNDNEGVTRQKVAYGVHAGYEVGGFRINAAYQEDRNGTGINDADTGGLGAEVTTRPNTLVTVANTDNILNSTGNNLSFNSDKEWGLGMAYKFSGFELGGSYARAVSNSGATIWNLALNANNQVNPATGSLVVGKQKLTTWSVYATADITNSDRVYVKYMEKKGGGTLSGKASVMAAGYAHDLSKRTSAYLDVARYKNTESETAYSVGMRHAF